MAIRKVATSVLTDIGNAIRAKNGTAALYRPGDMAAAVLALDGRLGEGAGVEDYKNLESGVVSDTVFGDIGAAIRTQNGTSEEYWPQDMAAAILALEFDVGLKVRALYLEDGVLEFSYRDVGTSPLGAVVERYEVDAAGYAELSDVPWRGIEHDVVRVVFDASMAGVEVPSMTYWFYGFTALAAVEGLGNLRGVSEMRYTFTSCSALRELDFSGFNPSALTDLFYCFAACSALDTIYADADWTLPDGASGFQTFYNCTSLVGGNGASYDSAMTSCEYMRIDAEGTPGYLTAR